jgi:hypothetical protein
VSESRSIVQFSRDLPAASPATRAGLRLGSLIITALGVVILLGGVIVAILVVARGAWLSDDVVLVPSVIMGGLMTYLGLVGLRRARTAADNELSLRAPFAFAVNATTIEFPGTRFATPETWDRATTSVAVRGSGVLRHIELTSAGKRSRNYLVRVLDGDAGQIAELVRTGPIGS